MSENELLKRITFNPEIFNGKPIIRGKRIAVEHVLGMLAAGSTIEELLDGYPFLEREDINACVSYAHRIVSHERIEPAVETATPHISDTPPHIRDILIAGYRRMSPQKKLKRVSELTKAVQQLALARIRQQYGRLSEQEQRLRLASLWLDRETMIRVFNWDPSVKGY